MAATALQCLQLSYSGRTCLTVATILAQAVTDSYGRYGLTMAFILFLPLSLISDLRP